MSFHLRGSSGPFSVAGFELSISDSVTDADSALFFGFGSADGGAAAGHFSSYNITGRYESSVLPLNEGLSGLSSSQLFSCVQMQQHERQSLRQRWIIPGCEGADQ